VKPIAEAELQAYVDGRLDPGRHEAVRAWLAAHPTDRSRVAAYRMLAELCRAAYADVLGEPVPEAVASPLDRAAAAPGRAWRFAVAAMLVAVVGLAAWDVGGRLSAQGAGMQMAQQASLAHAAYADEPNPAVAAVNKAEVLARLSGRLGMKVDAPDLAVAGLSFIAGELLALGTVPAALLIYEGKSRQRVSLYWGPEFKQSRETGLRYAGGSSGTRVYYWLDDECGYAISSATLAQKDLLRVALMAYAQLEK
jgi:anti-sigma factor RsiW